MSHLQPIDQGLNWFIPKLNNLRFMQAHYVRHAFKPHSHDYYVISIIEAGVQSFTHERKRLITTPNHLIVLNPGDMHTGESAVAEGFVYRAFYPTVTLMQQVSAEFQQRKTTLPEFAGGIIHHPRLYHTFTQLHRLSANSTSLLEVEAYLTHFLVEMVRHHAVDTHTLPHAYSNHQAVLRVRDYIEAHYADNISLSDLSQLVNISPYHLARLFAQQMGIPPHKYLEAVRIRHAEQLLIHGWSIADVTYHTGFSSQSHLTKTFKRFIGTTPAHFAQQRKIV